MKVSIQALIKRINRRLRKDGERIATTRGERWRPELGDYYAKDIDRNVVTQKHVDPEAWGRDLGVLRAHEQVTD